MTTLRTKSNQGIVDRNPCPDCGPGTRVWLKGGTPIDGGIKRRMVCFKCGRSYYAQGKDMWVVKFKRVRKAKQVRETGAVAPVVNI